ncbi:MAG: oxygenase MpaB family protein [Pseudomonadota bacterium]|nr:oxygenase MpaB family protein [Pseudomonadota bacterium]
MENVAVSFPDPTPQSNPQHPDTTAIPSRALPWEKASRQWLPKRIAQWVFGAPLAPSEQEWQRITEALWQGDEAMDKVVAWMFESNPGQRKRQFDQALLNGIETVADAPAELKAFFQHIDREPDWLDRDMMEEGIAASHFAGDVAFYVLRDMALMGGYAYFNTLNQALAMTGALSKKTSLRLGETGKWLNDVTEPGGLDRFGEGFITTIRVRMVHALVRRNLNTKPQWRHEKWGLPINQMDMLATYLAFGPVTLMGVRMFGVPVTPGQSKAVMHMWRYIGWLLGMDEQWLALTERDGLRKLYHTFLTHNEPDEKIRFLGEALRDEPLSRRMPGLESKPGLAGLLRKYHYHKHISNSALMLGPLQRKQLGIPMLAVPWYPVMTAPFRLAQHLYHRMRGSTARALFAERLRERQLRLLDAYFEGEEKDIIQPDADHPAHVS